MDDTFWALLGQSTDDKEMEDAFWASIAGSLGVEAGADDVCLSSVDVV
jgi:hypothetical protein